MAVQQDAKNVPNFTLPSDLSGKLWKSMGITPKKLVCEKEFYERILMVPQQKRTVWECITQHESSRSTKTTKQKMKAKLKVTTSPPGSPGEVSTSASMSRKAKLLAGGLFQAKASGQEELPVAPMQQLSPKGSFALGEVRQDREFMPDDGRGERIHDQLSEELGWGANGRRGELGSCCGSKARHTGGKRKTTCINEDEDRYKPDVIEREARYPDQFRIKVRKLDSAGTSSQSGASDRSSKEHCGLVRRDSNRTRNEAESASSSLEISDQALALKLHYAMNHRPSRRGQRGARSSGQMPLELPNLSCLDDKDASTQDISSLI